MAPSEFINEGFIIGSRADMVLLGKAIRENWQMTEACRESIVSQLKDIYTNDRRDRWRLAA